VDFSDVTWDVSDVTGGKKLSIKSMTVTADGQTVTIERDAANGSLTVTLPDQPAVTLDEDTIDTYLRRASRVTLSIIPRGRHALAIPDSAPAAVS